MKNNNLGIFFSKKIIRLITLLIALCVVTFVLMELSPIDPVTAYVGASSKVSAAQRELIAQHWGLNQPPVERFMCWFKSIIQGDWGTSLIYRRPVLEVIGQKFKASLYLMIIASPYFFLTSFLIPLFNLNKFLNKKSHESIIPSWPF